MDAREGAGRRSVGASTLTRRRLLGGVAGAGAAALAGCTAPLGGGEAPDPFGLEAFRGSGPLVADRPEPGGTRMADLPALSGTLTLYLGGGEGGRYVDLVELIERRYDGFTVDVRTNASAALANTIVEETERGESPADVFVAIDAGSLGVVADAGATAVLPDEALEPVPAAFRDDGGRWVGVEGRARSIPFNTDVHDAADVPEDVDALADASTFGGPLGWAPTYGAFQSFVTAMRLLRGRAATRDWLEAMVARGLDDGEYPDEFLVSNAVADGEITAGFANHYYALRVRAARPEAPIDLAFTRNDAGALVNVSGAALIADSDQQALGAAFVRHLLSAEAQEFFATRTFGYPVVPEVPPVGELPTIDELNPPDVDLTALSDLQPTLDLLREVGIL